MKSAKPAGLLKRNSGRYMIYNLKNIFQYIEAVYLQSVPQANAISIHYRLGAQIIQVEYAHAVLFTALHPAIAHLQSNCTDLPDLCIRVMEKQIENEAEAAIWLNANSLEPASNFISADGTMFMQRTDEGALSLVDRVNGKAYYWIQNLATLPYWEIAAPLRIIINWWGIVRGLQLLHAAAIGYQGCGILLAGKSGTGKSSTAVACLAGGMDYLGDDHVILDTSAGTVVHSIFATAKLNDDMADLFMDLDENIQHMPRREGEKQTVFLPAEMISASLPVDALLVPFVTGAEETMIEPASPMLGMLALVPSTMLYCPGGADQTLKSLGEIGKNVPTYKLLAGTNREKMLQSIKQWIQTSIMQGED